MSVKIIVDSASDITQEEAKEWGIRVLPMKTSFGEEEFLDGINITHEEFFEKLIETDHMPVTSQITPYEFQQAFDEEDENDELVCITMSSKLSGTWQSAQIASLNYDGRVKVVDSFNVTVGERILVMRAVEMVKQGMNAAQIAAALDEEKNKIRLVALLDTLEYLKKGGRISAAVAVAGTILGIKPVIAISDGLVVVLGKARGSKNGNNLLCQMIRAEGGIDFDMPLSLAYSGLNDSMLQKYIKDSAELYKDYDGELVGHSIGSTIGTHIGPGAIAIAYFVK